MYTLPKTLSRFAQVEKTIYGIQAIDYFFAKELTSVFYHEEQNLHNNQPLTKKGEQPNKQQNEQPDKQQNKQPSKPKTADLNDLDIIFHLLLALSEGMRNGHTCLPLSTIANSRYGFYAQRGHCSHQGFQFPPIDVLNRLLQRSMIEPEQDQAIVYFGEALYTRRYFNFERSLKTLIRAKTHIDVDGTALAEFSTQQAKQCLSQLFPETNAGVTGSDLKGGDLKDSDLKDKDLNKHGVKASKQENDDVDWQKIAVANALNKNFTVIAGGPGTGKTYTVTKLLAALVLLHQQARANIGLNANVALSADHALNANQVSNDSDLNIALVAPTGKAAQRLSESIINAVQGFKGLVSDTVLSKIPDSAHTIHRLLGVIPNQVQFKHHSENLLNIDVLLVDEVSMVDLALMHRLLQAIPSHCKVILLGDADQLPSVAIGNVLTDIAPRPHPGYSPENTDYLTHITGIKRLNPTAGNKYKKKKGSNSQAINADGDNAFCDHLTILTKSRRFDGEGGIGQLAQAVIHGEAKKSWQLLTHNAAEDAEEVNKDGKSGDSHTSIPTEAHKSQQPLSELACHQDELIHWLTPLIKQYYLPLFAAKTIEDAFSTLARFRVLCATRVGEQGVVFINELIKNLLFQHQGLSSLTSVQQGNAIFHAQPIMIGENNYALGLYNGDIGFIWRQRDGQLLAGFPDITATTERDTSLLAESSSQCTQAQAQAQAQAPVESAIKWIMPARLPQYETVYAMTIHKTQGSEFEHVAMVLPNNSENKLLSRELLYTAITRAKKQLTVGTTANVWHSGVELAVERYSGFNQ